MFDLSLRPICGVQYGGNLHNVPQQGASPPFLQETKAQFILGHLEKVPNHKFLTGMFFNIQKIFSTCLKFKVTNF